MTDLTRFVLQCLAAKGHLAAVGEGMPFADLLWEPLVPLAELLAMPPVRIEGLGRYVVMNEIAGEIRYYAGPVKEGGNDCEIGVLGSREDAMAFVFAYLDGAHLPSITVPRRFPDGRERQVGRP